MNCGLKGDGVSENMSFITNNGTNVIHWTRCVGKCNLSMGGLALLK